MSSIMSVERSRFINKNIELFSQNKVGQYSKFLDKTPFFAIYFHINTALTRVDVGTGGIEHELGDRSPIRFNKITNFPLYNIPELKPDAIFDESGFDVEIDASDVVVLPGTLKPLPGDYVLITFPGVKEFLFRVHNVRYNTIQSNDFYLIDLEIKDIGEGLERKRMASQIVEEYYTIFENIGTEDRCFLRSTDIDAVTSLSATYREMKDYYKTRFLHPVTGSMVLENGYTLNGYPKFRYDSYLEHFINRSQIYYEDNSTEAFVLTPADVLDPRFEYKFSKTLYRAVLDRDIIRLASYLYGALQPIQRLQSPFSMFAVPGESVILVESKVPQTAEPTPMEIPPDAPFCVGISNLNLEEYFPFDYIEQIKQGEFLRTHYFERIIFDFLHGLNRQISRSQIYACAEAYETETFYYLPMVIYILGVYYHEFFRKTEDDIFL